MTDVDWRREWAALVSQAEREPARRRKHVQVWITAELLVIVDTALRQAEAKVKHG